LLVEDEPAVREVAAQFLRNCGYKVVVATHGLEAVELVRDHNVAFDLLVTDVVLPAMNGRQLYDQLRESRPGLRVVFMSGYTDDLIAHHGVLEPGVSFVEKPFNQETLARKVRETLDRGGGQSIPLHS
jgi:CheY-like chemotaxis protein